MTVHAHINVAHMMMARRSHILPAIKKGIGYIKRIDTYISHTILSTLFAGLRLIFGILGSPQFAWHLSVKPSSV